MSAFHIFEKPNENCFLVEPLFSIFDRLKELAKINEKKQSWITDATEKVQTHRENLQKGKLIADAT